MKFDNIEIRDQVDDVLKAAQISLDNTRIKARLYTKVVQNGTKDPLSKEELQERKTEVVTAIGGEHGDFDTCLQTVVQQILESNDTTEDIAFKYYVVCIYLH